MPWLAMLGLALGVYAFGLGGQYIPTNGDELVYAHIARITAQTGHWLPLASELDNMRNTKPPLLFWQGMVAGEWGRNGGVNWHMGTLRLPSLIYTFLTTLLVAAVARRITRDPARALLAACLYLAFFSTYRYGRPYLTSAPETFWLALPMWALMWASAPQLPGQNEGGIGNKKSRSFNVEKKSIFAFNFIENNALIFIPLLIIFGAIFGIGLLYKSFALIAPASAAMGLALVLLHQDFRWQALLKTALQVGLCATVALAIFALWFAVDPDPAAVWREFVVGENVGKMGDRQGYWHEALWGGGSSLWAQLLAYVENAGLLAFVVVGLAAAGLRWLLAHRQSVWSSMLRLPAPVLVLLAWLLVWLLVFAIPSQRSARYVIPAMPALAILLALTWERIARGWFVACMVLAGFFTLVMARVAGSAGALGIASGFEVGIAYVAVAGVVATLLCGLLRPAWTRACTVLATLLGYLLFGLTTSPLDGPAGRYSPQIQAQLRGQKIAVPSNFNAQWERFEFLLPGNRIRPFAMTAMADGDASKALLADLLGTHEAVVWGQASPLDKAPPCLPNCQVVAQRWIVKERHQSGDITRANMLYPEQWLFSREWLVKPLPRP